VRCRRVLRFLLLLRCSPGEAVVELGNLLVVEFRIVIRVQCPQRAFRCQVEFAPQATFSSPSILGWIDVELPGIFLASRPEVQRGDLGLIDLAIAVAIKGRQGSAGVAASLD
jgi:hypothetical protein